MKRVALLLILIALIQSVFVTAAPSRKNTCEDASWKFQPADKTKPLRSGRCWPEGKMRFEPGDLFVFHKEGPFQEALRHEAPSAFLVLLVATKQSLGPSVVTIEYVNANGRWHAIQFIQRGGVTEIQIGIPLREFLDKKHSIIIKARKHLDLQFLALVLVA